ncbi:proline-rich protein 36-like [Danaus plexippus]|uniref:proline-rich protein 36-like n=1 Tax=Danaus plexippus TaxID=13037 RepID=UPI002AB045FC|nr:proline-rich protein 36-like [Danaus plexippus]
MAPPSNPKPLPALAEDVSDAGSLHSVVTALAATIITTVVENKSVTSAAKTHIVQAAEEIRKAISMHAKLPASSAPADSLNTAPLEDAIVTSVQELARSIASVQAELKALHSRPAQAQPAIAAAAAPVAAAAANPVTTAAAAAASVKPPPPPPRPATLVLPAILQPPPRTQPQPKSPPMYAQQASRPAQPVRSTPPAPVQPKPIPVTRPAILVATKHPTKSRQEAVEAFKKSISFRDCTYAPAKFAPVSNNKIRVEFDTQAQCDDALTKLRSKLDAPVTAEPARKLKPMLLLKGVSSDMAPEDLVSTLLRQNPELHTFNDTDITFRFKRGNNNI